VLMRVTPTVSAVNPTQINLGNGATGTVLDLQTVDTTIVAQDGETVILGGIISKRDAKAENKIPVLGDIPYVGAAFRYRTRVHTRKELLVILTPHIVRSRADMERIAAEETQRLHWMLPDVMRTHGFMGQDLWPGIGAPLTHEVPHGPLEQAPAPKLIPGAQVDRTIPATSAPAKDLPAIAPVASAHAKWESKVRFLEDIVHGGWPTPGIAADLYLFAANHAPAQADGIVQVELFDVSQLAPGQRPERALECWRLDKESLKSCLGKDGLGLWKYTLFLPW